MNIKKLLAAVGLVVVVAVHSPLPARADSSGDLRRFAERAGSEDAKVSASAIAFLRTQGPAGLEALLAANAGLVQRHNSPAAKSSTAKEGRAWERFQAAVDAVGAQRDCAASQLYWYTNLDDAKAAAKAGGKPILSLRLLGNLNEEYSCANSRFFRTTLYANAEVSQYLREHFILHWKSVRPVPRITIDFGDGRKIERTITGNSIHYILDAEGRAIDALPGLYSPKAFLKGLASARECAMDCATLPEAARGARLLAYHRDQYDATVLAWNNDLRAIGYAALPGSNLPGASSLSGTPTAYTAGRVAMTKAAVEIPMIKSMQKRADATTSIQTVDDSTWVKIAALHADEAVLDGASRTLLRAKNPPTAFDAARLSMSKSLVEDPLNSALRNLERSIAEDTVRNEYALHSELHQWFISGAAPADLDQLNRLVYARLFLTPDSDPWLGLAPANTITGLDHNGLVGTKP